MADTKMDCGVTPERCHELLTAIHTEVKSLHDLIASIAEIKTEVGMMRKDHIKLIFVLLSMVAASIGVEFLGTPWYVHVMGYSTWFVGVFLIVSTWFFRRRLTRLSMTLRFSFSGLLLYSIFTKTFLYDVRFEEPPCYMDYVSNFGFIFISVLLFMIAWRKDGYNK